MPSLKSPLLKALALGASLMIASLSLAASAREKLNADWRFARFGLQADGSTLQEPSGLETPAYDDASWRRLDLPHDWGIEGPFRTDLPGSTGKLPWAGIGWYRKVFRLPSSDQGSRVYLDIEGAMSHSTVWLNGEKVGGWPYGYSSYRLELTQYLRFGAENVLAVRLDNPPDSSRWYPGGGIYRNVWLVKLAPVHFAHWGIFVSTPEITSDKATVSVSAEIEGRENGGSGKLLVRHEVLAPGEKGALLATVEEPLGPQSSVSKLQIPVSHPELWNLDSPKLYRLRSTLLVEGKQVDVQETSFGIRTAVFTPDDGFHLNGKRVPIQGVCEHHDLGPLGSAFYVRAMERKLEILRSMGVNAIRTSHNPPAPELLELCDRMGFLVMDEAFDCWRLGKTSNDYGKDFDAWHERDLANLVRRDRNHPSVILWSSGNEINEQGKPGGAELARALTDIIKRHDPTRQVTMGLNHSKSVENGFYKGADVIGINYKPHLYASNRKLAPTTPVFASESSSTVSSRGVYVFPVSQDRNGGTLPFQVSSYDLYFPPWAQTPDMEWKGEDQNPFVAGEFVWTGFDYLGEPTPFNDDQTNLLNYQTEADKKKAKEELEKLGGRLPSRSSYFGIVDLCGFPKDRFYLYQARWRPEHPMAHILPHWTWPDRVGEVTPVHVYTSGDEAELFLNGRSLGRQKRQPFQYRFVWNEVRYEPGELKVVTYKNGHRWAEAVQRTAGAAARLEVSVDRPYLRADGEDLAYVTVKVVDKDGGLVPAAANRIEFELAGGGELVAVCNGDATDFDSFQGKSIRAFSGMAQAIVRAKRGEAGKFTLTAKTEGLKPAAIAVQSRAQ